MTKGRGIAELLAFDRFTVVGDNSGGAQCKAWLESQGKTDIIVTDDIRYSDRCFVIGTYRQREVAHQLNGSGVPWARIWPFVNDMFAGHYGYEFPHNRLAAIYRGMGDVQSQSTAARSASFFEDIDPYWLWPNENRIGHYGYNAPGANPKPGYRIIDAGAHTGDTIPEYLSFAGPDCRIHAIEGDAATFDELCRNVPPQAEAIPAMLSDKLTLDRLFPERHIDYIKIDVEGDDMTVLEGAKGILARSRPTVACAAYHKPEHITEVAEFLLKHLAPCKLYAGHDPKFHFHIHYIAVPEERAN